MSEKQQCSTAGEIAEECIALLEDTLDYMDELLAEVRENDEVELTEIGYQKHSYMNKKRGQVRNIQRENLSKSPCEC